MNQNYIILDVFTRALYKCNLCVWLAEEYAPYSLIGEDT